MVVLIVGFKKLPTVVPESYPAVTTFSIIIPFRNEAENLPQLLNSLQLLKYPSELFEIILINDESEDDSEEITMDIIARSKITFHLIQNKRKSNSPKKDAISEGISHSKFEWIVTTDADCELPENWLKTMDSFIQNQITRKNNPVMICGPVLYKSNGSFIENFQQMDGFSLQTVTMGCFGFHNPILCNGANLSYKKDSFFFVNGFQGNDHLASGDDIFLMEKMKNQFPEQIFFLKSLNSIVTTNSQKNWENLINQRVRWASKTTKQNNPISLSLGFLVTIVNIIFLAIPLIVFFDSENIPFYILLFLLKILVDLIVVQHTADFFQKRISLWQFTAHNYTYAVLLLIILFKGFIGKYTWKERLFQNQK